jgi:hypothetical protein
MPVCDRCGITYGDGELHLCQSTRRLLPRVFVGPVIGAATATIAVTVHFGLRTGSPQSGLVGAFVGGPLGAAIGALIAASTGQSAKSQRQPYCSESFRSDMLGRVVRCPDHRGSKSMRVTASEELVSRCPLESAATAQSTVRLPMLTTPLAAVAVRQRRYRPLPLRLRR